MPVVIVDVDIADVGDDVGDHDVDGNAAGTKLGGGEDLDCWCVSPGAKDEGLKRIWEVVVIKY